MQTKYCNRKLSLTYNRLEMNKIELDKIYNEDCLEGIKRIPDVSIDAIITDPPYFIGMTHNGKKGITMT